MRLFWAKVFPLALLLTYIAVVGTTFNIFSYDAEWNLLTLQRRANAKRVTIQSLLQDSITENTKIRVPRGL